MRSVLAACLLALVSLSQPTAAQDSNPDDPNGESGATATIEARADAPLCVILVLVRVKCSLYELGDADALLLIIMTGKLL